MVDLLHHLLLLTTRLGGDIPHHPIGERGQGKEEAEHRKGPKKGDGLGPLIQLFQDRKEV